MKNNHRLFYALSVLVFLLSGCVSFPSVVYPTVTTTAQAVPGTHYDGVVTDTTYPTVNNLVHIDIVMISKDNQTAGISAIMIIPPEAELFYDEQGTLYPYKIQDIVVGQKFIVTASEVYEGMPPGIFAKKIVFLDMGPQDSLTPILTWTKPNIEGVINEVTKNDNLGWSGVNLTIDGADLPNNVEHLFTFISVTERTLIWSKVKDGYLLRKLDDLHPGQSVTILLGNNYDNVSPGTYNPVVEIIVDPD